MYRPKGKSNGRDGDRRRKLVISIIGVVGKDVLALAPPKSNDDVISGFVQYQLRPINALITGRNLLHDNHVEFGVSGRRGAIERSVYASLTWRR